VPMLLCGAFDLIKLTRIRGLILVVMVVLL
jgi:hypothetical protein